MSIETTRIPAPDTAPDLEKRDPPAPGDRPLPRAGRTGLAGSRAERPADGSTRNCTVPVVGRGGKAPSAEQKCDEELPKPMRDSTA